MKYLIHEECSDFVAPALRQDGKFDNSFRLSEHFAGRYGVIFFYPLDFNFISQTELLSLQKRLPEFERLDTAIAAVSCDSYLAHRAWQNQPLSHEGVGKLDFPVISDMTRVIAKQFDVLVADAIPEPATIIVDPENQIIFQMRHDSAVGRNIDRIIEAITVFKDSSRQPTSPYEQIMLVEQNAAELKRLGYTIVAQSIDTPLDHPQWKLLPRDNQGNIKLSFPFHDGEQGWPQQSGMTIAIREGLHFHSTGLLMPDGQLLFELHTDRQITRDFTELLRLADAVKEHFDTGNVVPWEPRD